jgi:hypothetical protein
LVVLGGRRVCIERPRGRGGENTEIELDTWKVLAHRICSTSLVVDAGSSA